MSERVWYRSLYWRIALGIIVLLVTVLVVQAAVFVWLISRTREALPPRALQQSARAMALELETALAQDPALDLDRFVHERVTAVSRPIILVWHDRRVFFAGVEQPPDWLVEFARARLDRSDGGRATVRARRILGVAPVQAGGHLAGVIAVLPGPMLGTVVRELGPMLFLAVAVLAAGGTAVAALLIFGPAHRRLRGLEDAARDLGTGRSDARAPETGGDEIAMVARTFNTMASDIVRRAEALETADRVRRQLLADVSHELMTPLTAMRGYLETLRLPDLPLDSAARERYLGIVLDETLRLEHLIQDLLDLARFEAGGPAFTTGEVRVAELFERVRSRHERTLTDKGVTLDAVVRPGAETLIGDGDRLEQALQNLAANALRHAPRGGRVRLMAEPAPGDRIRLAVSDNGPGIPAEHLPFVFDRFYKVDAARAPAGGSGLGLSIVRAIAERHGGEVRVLSAPGVETVFELTLPRRAVATTRGGTPAARGAAVTASPPAALHDEANIH